MDSVFGLRLFGERVKYARRHFCTKRQMCTKKFCTRVAFARRHFCMNGHFCTRIKFRIKKETIIKKKLRIKIHRPRVRARGNNNYKKKVIRKKKFKQKNCSKYSFKCLLTKDPSETSSLQYK